MDLFLAAGGGFLLAVIWMDLMFDVLALGRRGKRAETGAGGTVAGGTVAGGTGAGGTGAGGTGAGGTGAGGTVAEKGIGGEELSEEALAQIAGYYRRVTTTASPMNLLISAVMAAVVLVLALQLLRGGAATAIAATSLVLCGVPVVLALTRVFPNAIRLGTRRDGVAEQSRLARAICIDHILCFAAMLAFVVLRLCTQA